MPSVFIGGWTYLTEVSFSGARHPFLLVLKSFLRFLHDWKRTVSHVLCMVFVTFAIPSQAARFYIKSYYFLERSDLQIFWLFVDFHFFQISLRKIKKNWIFSLILKVKSEQYLRTLRSPNKNNHKGKIYVVSVKLNYSDGLAVNTMLQILQKAIQPSRLTVVTN